MSINPDLWVAVLTRNFLTWAPQNSGSLHPLPRILGVYKDNLMGFSHMQYSPDSLSNTLFPLSSLAVFFLIYKFIYFNWRLITLQYCSGFAINQHESPTGIHVLPILNPPPSSLPIPSLWVVSVHQPQASSIMHQTWTGDLSHT